MKLLNIKEEQLQQILMKTMQFVKQKTQYFTCLLLITYFYLKKYKAKQKHLLPFYVTNNELKEALH